MSKAYFKREEANVSKNCNKLVTITESNGSFRKKKKMILFWS